MSHFDSSSAVDLRLLPAEDERPVKSGQVTDLHWNDWVAFTCHRYLVLSRKGCSLIIPWEHLALMQDGLDLASTPAPATPFALGA